MQWRAQTTGGAADKAGGGRLVEQPARLAGEDSLNGRRGGAGGVWLITIASGFVLMSTFFTAGACACSEKHNLEMFILRRCQKSAR